MNNSNHNNSNHNTDRNDYRRGHLNNHIGGNPAKNIAQVKADHDSPIAICLATIEIALTKPIPEIDAARSALDKLERESCEQATTGQVEQVDLNMPLSLTSIHHRTVNALENKGILTVGQLLNKQPEELLRIPNFGLRTLTQVRLAMRELGFGMEREQ